MHVKLRTALSVENIYFFKYIYYEETSEIEIKKIYFKVSNNSFISFFFSFSFFNFASSIFG